MHRYRPPLPLMLAAALAFGAIACGDGANRDAATATTAGRTATPGGSPAPITLQIVSPVEGADVTNPITLQAQATGIQIAAPSEQVPGAAHFDAFLDKDPVAEGKLVPSGPGIFHFTDSVRVLAAPGEHTVTVVLSKNDHVRLRGAPTARVTFRLVLPPTPVSPTP